MGKKREITPSERNIFREAVDSVTPGDVDKFDSSCQDQHDDITLPYVNLDTLPSEKWVQPNDIIQYGQKRLSDIHWKRLLQGKLSVHQTLDCHGLTIDETHHDLALFIQDAHNNGFQNLLVIHGKGSESPRPAVLKNYVYHVLSQAPCVLACHSAHRKHGGPGALYVILKNPKKRSTNQEF